MITPISFLPLPAVAWPYLESDSQGCIQTQLEAEGTGSPAAAFKAKLQVEAVQA